MTEGDEGERADPDKDAGAQFAVLVRLQPIGQDDDIDSDCVKHGGSAVAGILDQIKRRLTAARDKHEEAVQVSQLDVAVEPVVERAEETHRAGKQDPCDAVQSISLPLRAEVPAERHSPKWSALRALEQTRSECANPQW